ncbi:MAG: PD40 domain-containing protein [Lentisphaeria bacterium]|nr:PD40 domain-containing protein [Lentisphaeria bacterium]
MDIGFGSGKRPFRRRLALGLGALACLCAAGLCRGASQAPRREERLALEALQGRIRGQIVWESNRSGQWELYAMAADGSDPHQLTRLASPGEAGTYRKYLRPRLSPDGSTVLFAYGRAGAPCEAWTISSSGQLAMKRTVGAPLDWFADGRRFAFVRDYKLWCHDLRTGKDTALAQTPLPVDGSDGDLVGAVTPDFRAAVFQTLRGSVFLELTGSSVPRSLPGTEPRLTADGRFAYWVAEGREVRFADVDGRRDRSLWAVSPGGPPGRVSCPTVSADGRWLIFCGTTADDAPDGGDSELFLQELENWKPTGPAVRLTFHPRTDRWPCIWTAASAPAETTGETTAPQVGAAGAAGAGERPRDLPIFFFTAEGAAPEYGGDWGLWPQIDQCRGDLTFLPGGDAEGGPGGAVRIDYTLRAEPRSFSLWTTPRNDLVDLSSFRAFVMYAKGSVPSFTLVVKDRNARDPNEPDGIADAVVRGVTAEWQRFEVPFQRFLPRRRDAHVDWRTVNHVGIALIAPANAEAGTLFVDNLRAAPAPRP